MASLFREQNLDRVSQPDALDNYIRIAHPGVWMVLIAILLLLAAAVVWGLLGTVNVDRPGYLVVEDGAATLWVNESAADALVSGANVNAAGQEGMVTSAAGAPEAVSEVVADVEDGQVEFLREGQWIYPFDTSIDLPSGSYTATVTLESYTPLQLIFGGGQSAGR